MNPDDLIVLGFCANVPVDEREALQPPWMLASGAQIDHWRWQADEQRRHAPSDPEVSPADEARARAAAGWTLPTSPLWFDEPGYVLELRPAERDAAAESRVLVIELDTLGGAQRHGADPKGAW